MSRQQIANFSAFLMNWISDTANHETVSNAIASAIKDYNDEREAPQAAWDAIRYDFDVDVCPFENFSKDEFFKLCTLLEPRKNQSKEVQKLIQRILGVQNEYNRTIDSVTSKRISPVDLSQCEYWRRIEFSMGEVESLKKILPGSDASDLWVKLPVALLSGQEGVGFQYYFEKARKMVDQVSSVTKTVAAAACSKAMNLASENSTTSFSNSSLASPNARDFLLLIDDRKGAWEVASASFFLGRTSLKTRIIHAVCDVFYRSRTALFDERIEDNSEFVGISDEALKLKEDTRGAAARRLPNAATYEAQEARVLKLYAENTISPLTKPGHALQIYQSLLAIDYAAKVAKLSKVNVAEPKVDRKVEDKPVKSADPAPIDSQLSGAAALAAPPQRSAQAAFFSARNDNDDDYDLNDNRRSAANFKG